MLGREILGAGRRVYGLTGFEHEWRLAPQGHIIGRAPVEMDLMPATEELFQAGWAVTWSASVGAASSCDTFLITDQGPRVVTPTEIWPLKRIRIQGRLCAAGHPHPMTSDPLRLDDPCILFALRRESAPFLRLFPVQQRFARAPCRARFCGPSWLTVLVLETGVGPECSRRALDWLLMPLSLAMCRIDRSSCYRRGSAVR